jgi:hypothetical protein
MRNIFFAAFALTVLTVAVGPVRGQDIPTPRDIPAARLDELRKRIAPADSDEMLRQCSVLTAPEPRGFYSRPFSCASYDRACEVISKMHRRVGDDIGRLGTRF